MVYGFLVILMQGRILFSKRRNEGTKKNGGQIWVAYALTVTTTTTN